MDLNSLKDPKSIAEYFTFVLSFATKPRDTLRPYAGKTEIDARLLLFACGSVVLSYAILLLAKAMGAADDSSEIVRVIGSLDWKIVPLLLALLVVLVSVLFHLVAKVAPLIAERKLKSTGADPHQPHLGGTCWDTINAALGFSAFYLPVGIGVYACLTLFVADPDRDRTLVVVVFTFASLSLSAGILGYFPAALAGTHPNTSYVQALVSMMFSITIVVLVQMIAENVLGMFVP